MFSFPKKLFTPIVIITPDQSYLLCSQDRDTLSDRLKAGWGEENIKKLLKGDYVGQEEVTLQHKVDGSHKNKILQSCQQQI